MIPDVVTALIWLLQNGYTRAVILTIQLIIIGVVVRWDIINLTLGMVLTTIALLVILILLFWFANDQ